MKKGDRFAFRLPASDLQQAKLKRLPLSHICRRAVHQALVNSEFFDGKAPQLYSKKRSVQLWNRLSKNFVRTFPVEDFEKIMQNPFKLEVFRQISYQKCPDELLGYLGEFLSGGEYSEDVLDIYFANPKTIKSFQESVTETT